MTLNRTAMAAACAWLAVLGATTTARGQCLEEHLFASDGAASDQLGFSVAISGDTAVVCANHDDTPGGINAGSAYVFVRSGGVWTEQAQLFASDGAFDDNFRYSVAISGDTAVVGAIFDDTPGGTNVGSAYVFVRQGGVWTEQAHLFASHGAAGDQLGVSVAIDGDTAVVGAYGDDTPAGTNAGSVYVFVRSGGVWTQQCHLFASDGAAGDFFSGFAVAIDGDTLVIGAQFDDTLGGADAGSAYVFVRSGVCWTQQAHLFASDGAAFDLFGAIVAISGDTVVAGADSDDTLGGTDAGSAYVFVRDGGGVWTEEAHLFASDGAAGDHFGFVVTVAGDKAVVGAQADDTPSGMNAGSAYVFVRSTGVWSEQADLFASDGAADDLFGYYVAISGDTAVVGAGLDDTPGGTNAGSAYVFDLSANPPPGDCNLDCQVNLGDYAGLPACMSGPGAPSGAGCECHDLDDDTDADLLDFADLQNAFGGA